MSAWWVVAEVSGFLEGERKVGAVRKISDYVRCLHIDSHICIHGIYIYGAGCVDFKKEQNAVIHHYYGAGCEACSAGRCRQNTLPSLRQGSDVTAVLSSATHQAHVHAGVLRGAKREKPHSGWLLLLSGTPSFMSDRTCC